MGIVQELTGRQRSFSLEFSPPKKDIPVSSVYGTIEQLAAHRPDFVSITYGAGGGNRDRALEVVSQVNDMGLDVLAHLTCVGADSSMIADMLDKLEALHIKNVLALRGDVPEGMDKETAFIFYQHASDLIMEIKKRPGFVVGAAAYPEAHAESPSTEKDIEFMKLKAELGVDFFITQLCFDNCAVVEFYERCDKAGIHAPIAAGIMPVINPKQIVRMSLMSACSIPAPLSKIICLYGEKPDEFKKAGLDYAIRQIDQLSNNGINKFHLYTMNKADGIEQIITQSGLSLA